MVLKQIKTIHLKDYETNQFQSNVKEFADQLNSPVIDSVIFQGIEVTSGTVTVIDHGLEREIVGWFVVKKNADVNIWANNSDQELPTKQLVLSSSGDAVINLIVF